MEFIRPDTRYDFIGKKKFTIWISVIAILLSLGSIAVQGGLKYGVDFAGGLLVQVKFAKPIDIAGVRSGLEAMGFKDANVQKFGEADEFLVRVEKASENLEEISKSIQSSIRERFKDKTPNSKGRTRRSQGGEGLEGKSPLGHRTFLPGDPHLCSRQVP
jgi:preprotein translocase subunit SecF